MKINIEGGEYVLLESIIDNDIIDKITNIQVQFHDFVIEEPLKRMKKTQEKLSKTYKLTYQCEFVWENWEIKSKRK